MWESITPNKYYNILLSIKRTEPSFGGWNMDKCLIIEVNPCFIVSIQKLFFAYWYNNYSLIFHSLPRIFVKLYHNRNGSDKGITIFLTKAVEINFIILSSKSKSFLPVERYMYEQFSFSWSKISSKIHHISICDVLSKNQ